MGTRSLQSAGGNVVRLSDRRPPKVTIRTGLDLFLWTFRQLEKSQPQIAVGADLVLAARYLRSAIGTGATIVRPPLDWHFLFHQIRWDNIYEKDGPHCALGMISFVGQLCDLLAEEGPTKVCPVRASEMLLDHLDPHGSFVRYHKHRGQWLVSTAVCEQKHNVMIKVGLRGEPLDPVFWRL
jgi:hypothetical protein